MTLQAVGEEGDPSKALIKSQYLDELEVWFLVKTVGPDNN